MALRSATRLGYQSHPVLSALHASLFPWGKQSVYYLRTALVLVNLVFDPQVSFPTPIHFCPESTTKMYDGDERVDELVYGKHGREEAEARKRLIDISTLNGMEKLARQTADKDVSLFPPPFVGGFNISYQHSRRVILHRSGPVACSRRSTVPGGQDPSRSGNSNFDRKRDGNSRSKGSGLRGEFSHRPVSCLGIHC